MLHRNSRGAATAEMRVFAPVLASSRLSAYLPLTGRSVNWPAASDPTVASGTLLSQQATLARLAADAPAGRTFACVGETGKDPATFPAGLAHKI